MKNDSRHNIDRCAWADGCADHSSVCDTGEGEEEMRLIDADALKEEFTCKGDEWINNIIDGESK